MCVPTLQPVSSDMVKAHPPSESHQLGRKADHRTNPHSNHLRITVVLNFSRFVELP